MPHLVLEFNAARDVEEIAGKVKYTGKDHISFRIIDTDQGKVIELEADARNISQRERPGTWGELKVAEETLGRKPGGETVDKSVHDALKGRADKLEKEIKAVQADMVAKNQLILQLNGKIEEYERTDVKEGRDLLASALDSYLEDLAASQDFERYEQGKRVYRRLTGQKWVDDGSDDEEGDLSI